MKDDKPKQIRDRSLFDTDPHNAWRNAKGKSNFKGEKELDDALLELGKNEFDMNGVNSLNWKRNVKTDSDRGRKIRQVCCCHFKNESRCPYQICVIFTKETGFYQIFIGNRAHTDHSVFLCKRGIPSLMKAAMLTSPTSLANKGPKTTVRTTLFKKKWTLPADVQDKAARAVLRARKKFLSKRISGRDANTYDGLREMIRLYRRHELGSSGDFNRNTLFVCGDEYIVEQDEGKERVAVLFTTENLLLNAYRQTTTGQDLTLAVDCSYRYTWQGYGLLVLKVIDFSQSAHSLAWGLVSKEDDDAHVFVFQQLVAELNNVVSRCARNGEPI